MQRIRTGIGGLDSSIEGFPAGRTVLLTGEPGTGKTIFALQFASNACRQGLHTVFLITEETEKDLLAQADSVGLDAREHMESGLLEFVDFFGPRTANIEDAMKLKVRTKRNFLEIISEIPEDLSGKVLVVDNLGAFTGNLDLTEYRDRLDLLIHYLADKEITTLLVLDAATSDGYRDLSFYATYGAIRLVRRENPYTGERERRMDIVKMRNTMIPLQPLIYQISSSGIEVST